MEFYDHPVSGHLFISRSTIPALSGLFIIHYNPLQYFIIYFSITWNGIVLIPFYYFIFMEFFQPFLSKIFSNYSLGMVRVDFCRVFSFDFQISVRFGGTVKSPLLISSPPDRVFFGRVMSLVVDAVFIGLC